MWPGVWTVRIRSRPTSSASSSSKQQVVALEHAGILGADGDLVARVADCADGGDVVPVAMGLDDRAHDERPAHLQQPIVLVRRIDQQRVAGPAAPHDVDVVVDRADDEAVHLDGSVLPDPFDTLHRPIFAATGRLVARWLVW